MGLELLLPSQGRSEDTVSTGALSPQGRAVTGGRARRPLPASAPPLPPGRAVRPRPARREGRGLTRRATSRTSRRFLRLRAASRKVSTSAGRWDCAAEPGPGPSGDRRPFASPLPLLTTPLGPGVSRCWEEVRLGCAEASAAPEGRGGGVGRGQAAVLRVVGEGGGWAAATLSIALPPGLACLCASPFPLGVCSAEGPSTSLRWGEGAPPGSWDRGTRCLCSLAGPWCK